MKLTLRNDFHRTEAVVLVKDGIITSESMRNAERKLCGMKNCTCGDIRGPQDFESLEPVKAGYKVILRETANAR